MHHFILQQKNRHAQHDMHRIIVAMPCISYLDHAGSYTVVVIVAYVVCSSICLFPHRITKWCCEIRQVFRQVLLQLFTGEPTSSPILQFHSRCSLAIAILRFCCVTCPIHLLSICPRYTSSPYLLFVVCQLCES